MAVSLSGSLAEHQAGTRRVPAIEVTASASHGGVPILRWGTVHSGGSPGLPHAATLTPAGTLVRLRNNGGTLEAARTPLPGSPGAEFGAWTARGAVTAGSPVALASSAGEVLAATCSNSGKTIEVRSSSDDGASWSAPLGVVTLGSAVGALAIAFGTNGDACLFYVEGAGVDLWRLRRISGAWAGAGTAWTRSGDVASIDGVAACHDGGDFVLVLTGTAAATLAPTAWAAEMGDGGLPVNAWSTLRSIADADAGSSVSFAEPAVAAHDGDYFASLTRVESGAVAARATMAAHPLHLAGALSTWTEPRPWGDAADGAAAVAGFGADGAWAASPTAVFFAPLPPSRLLSERLLQMDWRAGAGFTRSLFEFDDAAGDLAADAALTPGNGIDVRLGYVSGAGGIAEYGLAVSVVIREVVSRTQGGRRVLRVQGDGAWEQLARWKAPASWQTTAAAFTRDELFAWLAARAGVASASAPAPFAPPSEWSSSGMAFALTPGESARAALARLLLGADAIVVPSGAGLRVRGASSDEAAAFALGVAGGHPIESLELVSARLPGRVRLVGDGRYADVFDSHDGEALLVHDASATTDSQASAHAEAVFRRRRARLARVRVRAPFHAGIEPGDVVAISNERAHLDGERFRVIESGVSFARGTGFTTELLLGDV